MYTINSEELQPLFNEKLLRKVCENDRFTVVAYDELLYLVCPSSGFSVGSAFAVPKEQIKALLESRDGEYSFEGKVTAGAYQKTELDPQKLRDFKDRANSLNTAEYAVDSDFEKSIGKTTVAADIPDEDKEVPYARTVDTVVVDVVSLFEGRAKSVLKKNARNKEQNNVIDYSSEREKRRRIKEQRILQRKEKNRKILTLILAIIGLPTVPIFAITAIGTIGVEVFRDPSRYDGSKVIRSETVIEEPYEDIIINADVIGTDSGDGGDEYSFFVRYTCPNLRRFKKVTAKVSLSSIISNTSCYFTVELDGDDFVSGKYAAKHTVKESTKAGINVYDLYLDNGSHTLASAEIVSVEE